VLKRQHGLLDDVVISIGAPRKRPNDTWECPVQVEGLGETQFKEVGGGDALQALQLALEFIAVTLERTGERLEWFENYPEFGPGITRSVPQGYGPRFEARVNLHIEREMSRIWKTRLKNRKADIAACEAEVKQRRMILAGLESMLVRRKAFAADWEAELKAQKTARSKKK
jgi:uncharacterized protein DUF6968